MTTVDLNAISIESQVIHVVVICRISGNTFHIAMVLIKYMREGICGIR